MISICIMAALALAFVGLGVLSIMGALAAPEMVLRATFGATALGALCGLTLTMIELFGYSEVLA